jgi:hypothetical protein
MLSAPLSPRRAGILSTLLESTEMLHSADNGRICFPTERPTPGRTPRRKEKDRKRIIFYVRCLLLPTEKFISMSEGIVEALYASLQAPAIPNGMESERSLPLRFHYCYDWDNDDELKKKRSQRAGEGGLAEGAA